MDNLLSLVNASVGDYTITADGYDEMVAPDGSRREHWKILADALDRLGSAELNHRYHEARRLMRDNGIAYNPFSDPESAERSWLLDPLPLILAHAEWRDLERGLKQRAELLNQLLADLYGPRTLLRDGILPPELVFSHPGFLRECAGLAPPSGQYLPLYSADLARQSDGTFCVIDNRSQAPPGSGYALENRMVLSRVLPSLFRDAQVHRLALYFRALRDMLMQLAWSTREDTRIVLLTPGPGAETYFEHVFLANYLGYTLVEGADLTVRDGQVWLKTLDGLQRIDVILRFVDDALCDPLELRSDSAFGIAGLLAAVRRRTVAVANPIGSGLVEHPALTAYLPALARYFLQQDLLLPSPATYWCGESKSRQHVLANLDRLSIRQTALGPAAAPLDTATLDGTQREQLAERIRRHPRQYVAQQPITPSTAPLFVDGRLQPRAALLRTYLVAKGDDYVAMPGGLCRVAAAGAARVEPVQAGGISKDVWITAPEPVPAITLLGNRHEAPAFAIRRGELPSRAAENLFWLGRYAERSESIVRLLRSVFLYLLEPDEDYAATSNRAALVALLQAVTKLTQTLPGFVGKGAEQRLHSPDAELLAVFLDRDKTGSLAYTLRGLLTTANSVRDRLSPDIWRVFNAVEDGLSKLQTPHERLRFSASGDNEKLNSALDELNTLLTAFAAFTGLAVDSMTHSQGWKFLMIGRRLERARQTVQLLDTTLAHTSEGEAMLLEYLLRICDSLMTYRSRYRSRIQLGATLELLLLDETNPRAVGYQLKQLHHDILTLPDVAAVLPYRRPEQWLILDALSRLRLSKITDLVAAENDVRQVLTALLGHITSALPELSDAIGAAYFSHAELPQQLLALSGGE